MTDETSPVLRLKSTVGITDKVDPRTNKTII